MASFKYNNKIITKNKGSKFNGLVYKMLCKTMGDVNKEISLSELLDGIKKVNIYNSLELLLIAISDFGIDLSNKKVLTEVEPIIINSTEKSIILYNNELKKSKIENADFFEINNSLNPNGEIKLESLKNLDYYNSFIGNLNFLKNTYGNAKLTAETILKAEANIGVYNLEVETVASIFNYIENKLNLNKIINAKNVNDAKTQLKNYTLKK